MRTLVLALSLFLGAPLARAERDPGSDEALLAFVRARARTLNTCVEIAEDGRSAKGNVNLEVQPDGNVSAVTVDDTVPHGVARCVAGRIRLWRFPSFDGSARKLSYALVFVSAAP